MPKVAPKFSVGQRIWRYDINRRKYREGQSGPIFKEYFTPYVVADIGSGEYKIRPVEYSWTSTQKFAPAHKEFVTDDERAAMIWGDARREIAEKVYGAEVEQLKRLADVVGFVPEGIDD